MTYAIFIQAQLKAPPPLWDPGSKTRIGPYYPYARRKGDWNGAVSRNNCKKCGPRRCLDAHIKEPYEMSIAREPDRRSIV